MKTNVVIISGGLVRDPESKFTPSGKQVVNFSIGTETGWGDKKESSYFNCVAWEKTAGAIADHLRKGSQVVVTGTLRQRRWEKDGQKHSTVEITVRQVEFGAKPRTDSQPADADNHGGEQPRDEQDSPAPGPAPADGGPEENTDIPF